jgi:hypothetical protein
MNEQEPPNAFTSGMFFAPLFCAKKVEAAHLAKKPNSPPTRKTHQNILSRIVKYSVLLILRVVPPILQPTVFQWTNRSSTA